eukprot:8003299-Pyramimonas_sp.AAC.2
MCEEVFQSDIIPADWARAMSCAQKAVDTGSVADWLPEVVPLKDMPYYVGSRETFVIELLS